LTVIVQRYSIKAKPGRSQEAIDLILSEAKVQRDRGSYAHAFRAYTPQLSGQPERQLLFEWEFEDLAQFQSWLDGWFAQSTSPAYLEKWHELVEQGTGTNEIWNLHTL
jgi:hypothetical protein